jgi:hypothetical protein
MAQLLLTPTYQQIGKKKDKNQKKERGCTYGFLKQ